MNCSKVYISVSNENDHLPLTDLPAYVMTMEENLASNTVIGQVTATDGDVEGSDIQYQLAYSSRNPPFAIDSTTGGSKGECSIYYYRIYIVYSKFSIANSPETQFIIALVFHLPILVDQLLIIFEFITNNIILY